MKKEFSCVVISKSQIQEKKYNIFLKSSSESEPFAVCEVRSGSESLSIGLQLLSDLGLREKFGLSNDIHHNQIFSVLNQIKPLQMGASISISVEPRVIALHQANKVSKNSSCIVFKNYENLCLASDMQSKTEQKGDNMTNNEIVEQLDALIKMATDLRASVVANTKDIDVFSGQNIENKSTPIQEENFSDAVTEVNNSNQVSEESKVSEEVSPSVPDSFGEDWNNETVLQNSSEVRNIYDNNRKHEVKEVEEVMPKPRESASVEAAQPVATSFTPKGRAPRARSARGFG